MGTKVAAPEPRDYGKETRDTLQAQVDLAPQLYAAEAEFQPKYTALNMQMLQDSLRGTSSSPGMLSLYENDIYPSLARIEASTLANQREADIAAVERYGSRATDALRTASGNAPLLNEMNRQAMEELAAGQSLTPAELRAAQQASRGAFSSRGLGLGNQAVADEVLKQYQLGNERQAQRRSFAGGVIGMNQQTGADPFMAILGRPSQAFAAGQGFGGQAMGYAQGGGPSLFNPESAYAGNMYNQNYQAQMSANAASGANSSAVAGAGLGAVAGIGLAIF